MARMGEAHAHAESCARQIGFSTAASIGGQSASLLYGPTPAPSAISACFDLLERADLAGRANVLASLGALHGLIGRYSEADDLLAESRAAYLEVGMAMPLHNSWSHAAFSVARLSGRLDEAETITRTSMDALLKLGETAWVATRAAQQADLALDHGADTSASKLATLAKRHASRHDVLVQILVMRIQARLKARRSDAVAAERRARRAVRLSEQTDDLSARADTLVALAEVLLLGGREADASEAAAEADALYEAKENLAGRDRARALLSTVQAA